MDWTLEDNMADGLRFCATLTGRRGGHTPFVQAGAETSDTGVETVKVEAVKSLGPAAGPKLFLGGSLWRVGAGDENQWRTVAILVGCSPG